MIEYNQGNFPVNTDGSITVADFKKDNSTNNFFIIKDIVYKTPVNYTKMREDAIEPTCGSAEAAGYDLYVPSKIEGIQISAHSTVIIDTGISVELPKGCFGAIFARSGLASKEGLRPANCVGVVDSDYRGSIGVAIHNDTNEDKGVQGGDRIAQLVVIPYVPITFNYKESLDETERGNNGFGSTGK